MQRGHKIRFNMCWPNPNHANEDTKWILTCVYQTNPMPVRTQNVTQQMLTKPIPCRRGHNMYLKLCKTNPPMTGRTQIVCQHVFTIHIPWMPGHTMYLNVCWSNPSLASENTKCISIWVDQIASYASGDTKWISTSVDQTHAMLASTQIASQYLYTKPLQCQRVYKL